MPAAIWDLPKTDDQCDYHAPGHNVFYIHFNVSMRMPAPVIPVTAVVADDGLVHITGDGLSLVLWNHRPQVLRAALLVLTAAVCRELGAATCDEVVGIRAREALGLLSGWMRRAYDLPERGDIRYSHGLDDPLLAQYASDFKHELDLGAKVCDALMLSYTADHRGEFSSDVKELREKLSAYRAEFDNGGQTRPPSTRPDDER